jgi:hypothetical protein
MHDIREVQHPNRALEKVASFGFRDALSKALGAEHKSWAIWLLRTPNKRANNVARCVTGSCQPKV